MKSALLATKCVTQTFRNDSLGSLLSYCLTLTYNAVHYAEEKEITNRKGMKGFYRSLKDAELPSCYKVAVITRACTVIESRRKSRRRGIREPKQSKPLRPVVCIISGFFMTAKGRLFIPLQKRNQYADVLLNKYAHGKIDGKRLRSLTITPYSLSICYSDEVEPIPVRTVFGVDRNEKNLTFGDKNGVVQIDLSKTVRIRRTTRRIVGSFKRPDVRVRKRLAAKYWKRATHRTSQMLHVVTNFMVDRTVADGAAFTLEDLTDIRKMYRKGNAQGR
jgi:putative transposase